MCFMSKFSLPILLHLRQLLCGHRKTFCDISIKVFSKQYFFSCSIAVFDFRIFPLNTFFAARCAFPIKRTSCIFFSKVKSCFTKVSLQCTTIAPDVLEWTWLSLQFISSGTHTHTHSDIPRNSAQMSKSSLRDAIVVTPSSWKSAQMLPLIIWVPIRAPIWHVPTSSFAKHWTCSTDSSTSVVSCTNERFMRNQSFLYGSNSLISSFLRSWFHLFHNYMHLNFERRWKCLTVLTRSSADLKPTPHITIHQSALSSLFIESDHST